MGWIQIYMKNITYQEQGRCHDVEAHGLVGTRSNKCTSNQCSNHHKEQEASHIWPSGVPCSHNCTRTHNLCKIRVDTTSILHSHMLHVHTTTRIIRKLSPNIDESIPTNDWPSSFDLIIHNRGAHQPQLPFDFLYAHRAFHP